MLITCEFILSRNKKINKVRVFEEAYSRESTIVDKSLIYSTEHQPQSQGFLVVR